MLDTHLPLDSPLERYADQAAALLEGHRARNPAVLALLNQLHPKFLDPVVTWKPLELSPDDIAAAAFDLADARLAVARGYSFRDWPALEELVASVLTAGSEVFRFEWAVEAVITGNLAALDRLLGESPDLARARSTRVTCHDPPVHGATLVHYLGANGVEGYRQRSPANAVAVARRLFEAGAESDALAGMYGGQCATLSMLVSSTPPADAGVQVPLVHALLDAGAAVDGVGSGPWRSPLRTALVFGFQAAAEALATRGARADDLIAAAGLGRVAEAGRLLPDATAPDRHAALALAAQLGHAEVVRLLLDAGEEPDRFNPEGLHAHGTPLHHAALAGHADVVGLLVDRGASLERRDRLWDATALGWALHGGQQSVADLLRARGAPE